VKVQRLMLEKDNIQGVMNAKQEGKKMMVRNIAMQNEDPRELV
jgi:hypothetical protein